MATRWHTDNVKPQCVKCNIYSQGEQFKFSQALGSKLALRMQKLSTSTKKFSTHDLESMIYDLKNKIKELTG